MPIKQLISALALGAMLLPSAALAEAAVTITTIPIEPQHYAADTTVNFTSGSLLIKAGSAYETIDITATEIKVTVPEGRAFEVRSVGDRRAINNDAYEPVCNVMRDRVNQAVFSGPKTVTISLSDANCTLTGYDTDNTPLLSMNIPVAGETLNAESVRNLFWSAEGRGIGAIEMLLSVDGGKTFQRQVFGSSINNGFHAWNVPLIETTSEAVLLLQGHENDRVTSFAVSPKFRIAGTDPIVAPVQTQTANQLRYGYDRDVEMAAYGSVDAGVGYSSAALAVGDCTPGIRLKLADSSAVYYCGIDGKRHAFPNAAVHASWFSDFVGTVVFTGEQMAKVQLGENVLYRPGSKMIKLTTDPKVYAVTQGGVLRWVETEQVAIDLYGADWNKMIDDVPDTFFADYTIGASIK